MHQLLADEKARELDRGEGERAPCDVGHGNRVWHYVWRANTRDVRGAQMKARMVMTLACAALSLGFGLTAPAAETPTAAADLPEWLFPIDPNSIHPPATPPKLDDKELLTIPGSKESFTAARIGDFFNPPDWHPEDHLPMPDVVAKGRKPDVFACAICHTPTGQGRPENAPIAGLPENYFRQQLLDMRSGARKPVGPV